MICDMRVYRNLFAIFEWFFKIYVSSMTSFVLSY